MTDQNVFYRFLQPRSVAIVGASPQAGTPRNALVKNLIKHGFQGAVYPVTPSHAEIEGLKAYKTVGDLPEVPDVALVITPANTVAGVIADDGLLRASAARVLRTGTRNAWLEIELHEGRNRQIRRLLAAFDVGVLRLVRVAIGAVALGELPKGAWRLLREDEVQALAGATRASTQAG